MFGSKRLVRVEVTLKHGGTDRSDIKESIELLPGQTFHKELRHVCIKEHGTVIKSIDWKAGYTVVYDYFYH